ncbi:L-lysine 6-oxidase [Andreprevotia sp. IGB-42]|uniref:LodA/GoxA family CTQ-dependent oxidase n=1 Tax=Andreprevotia sp. IGB-42 TaxID=2497473 RepID=UPI001359DB99|nr:LodA/GoxA family CTQ-dependent oxidase [Andreprevotia sp. IGB-42]KAF0811744.1 L-lysine 6-oxidase [Andreprevotia sp. IGB-42]
MNHDTPSYRIHPGIGIARLGDSPDAFCISPEKPAALPLDCDAAGNPLYTPDGTTERTVTTFKDAEGRVKRQAARFQLYVYDDENPQGRRLKIGDKIRGGGNEGTLIDIEWRVYVANKKAVWYEFNSLQGEHGYQDNDPNQPRRNADITGDTARQQLIIDPGPQIVNTSKRRSATMDRNRGDQYSPTFPPPLTPNNIDTLGELRTDDSGRLLVLGGHGNSGSFKDGFGHPRIDTYANNDGWFDDTSDGPVMARLVMYSENVGRTRYIDVEAPAWVIVGYPAYVPEVLDMITMDDVVYDMGIRQFATRPDLYGQPGSYDKPVHIPPNDVAALAHWQAGKREWNRDHYPWFYRDVWPILFRADEMTHLTNVLEQSNYPHNQTARGNFDPDKLSQPPQVNQRAVERDQAQAVQRNASGELLLDALEPALTRLEHGGQSLVEVLDKPLPGPKGSAAEVLKAAVAQFAAKVSPIVAGETPASYLLRWKAAYTVSEGGGNEAARQALDKVIAKLLAKLKAAAEPVAALKLLARRDDPLITDQGVPEDQSIELAVERVLKEFANGKLLATRFQKIIADRTFDPCRPSRTFLFDLLRQPGEENEFRLDARPNSRVYNLPLMPLLAGDNPINNITPSKFLRLTDYQLFLLRQWAQGKFYNEVEQGWVPAGSVDPWQPYANWQNRTGQQLDQGVLSNVLGGAFCPGGEVGWIMRNPSIYLHPYRIKADPDFCNFQQTAAEANQRQLPEESYLSVSVDDLSQDSNYQRGMQPGDLTKSMGLPWQSDFNECTTQMIDVTYPLWNSIDPAAEHDVRMKLGQQSWETLWWPAHRPLQTYEVVSVGSDGSPNYQFLQWARGIPQTNAGDLKMVTEWSRLGFVVRNPYLTAQQLDQPSPDYKYISVERTPADKP